MKKNSRIKATLIATSLAVTMTAMTGLPAMASTPAPTQISTELSTGATTEKAELLSRINAYRALNSLAPVRVSASLGSVAQAWSDKTALAGGFKHNPDFSTQIPQAWSYASEIIGAAADPEDIVFGWRNSPSHDAILRSAEATEVGFGYAYQGNPAGEYYGTYYATAIFADYKPATPVPPVTPVSVPVTAKAPSFTQANYVIPAATGVQYKVNGVIKQAGTFTSTGAVTVTAEALTGYTLNGTASWSHDYTVFTPPPVVTQPVPVTPPVTTPKPPSRPVTQPLSVITAKADSLKGALGKSTSQEIGGLKNGGRYQTYQLGAIYWTPATGAKVVKGAIRNVWVSNKAQDGFLGYPTTDEYKVLNGVGQTYQGGKIIWVPNKGTFVLRGAILGHWDQINGASLLGLPLSNENGGLVRGGAWQQFEKGVIYWSPATGAHVSKGAIRTAYGKIGFERSRLGYPKNNEYATSTGVRQDYEGGYITWTSKTGALKVTYK
jgi:uncharacterized protein with LGFP repeats/uncharacterized protein YkwD